MTTTPSGLKYRDLVVGTGEEARIGATAVVHYTSWLEDGTKFYSSVNRGTPLEFVIGRQQVIKGWEEGVGSMNVGGKRELIIPPDLAYGDSGAGGVIPPGATLKFEVELTYIARLRRKLEPEPSSPKFILLERGLGYRLKPGD